MTRFETLVQFIHDEFCSGPLDGWEDDEMARRILAIADSRIFWNPKECAEYIGREQPVWANWQRRRSHDVPTPAFRTSSGAMYDAEDVQEWASRPECYALLGDGSEARKATWAPTVDGASQLGRRIGRSVASAVAEDPKER